MNIFKRRPLALASFFFLLALAVSFFIGKKAKLLLIFAAVFILIVLILAFIFSKRSRNSVIALMLSALFVALAFFSSYRYFELNYNEMQGYAGSEARVEAIVTRVNYLSNYASYLEIKVSKIDSRDVSTKMKLECSYECELEIGDFFCADVKFEELKDDVNGYPEKMVGLSKGQSLVALSSSAKDITYVESGGFDLMVFASKLNAKFDKILSDIIGKESSGLSRALLLGNKGELTVSQDRDIRYVGVSHLLALSGMHLTILIGNIGYLLTAIRIPKKARLPILALLTASYVVLTAMQLSMVRSAIMLFIAYSAFIFGRDRDMMTSLFFSVALICFAAPCALFDIGLQLSFLSMVGIVAFQDTVNEFYARLFENIKSCVVGGALEYICVSVTITFIATVSVIPAIWLYFGETSLIAVLGNLILSPFADLILMISPLIIVFCKLPMISFSIGWCTGTLSEMMLGICSLLAQNRGVMLSLRYPFSGIIILCVSLVLAVMLIVEIERKRRFLIPIVFGVLAFCVCLTIYTNVHKGELDITYVSDGYNEGFVAISEGRALVCDLSSGSGSFANVLIYEQSALAVCDIEVYMLTHYHDRHIETFDKISDELYVRKLWLPSPVSEDEIYTASELCNVAKEKGIEVFLYEWNDTSKLNFESIEIDITRRTLIARSNQPIIALSFKNANARLTYIGSSVHESDIYEEVLSLASDSDAIVFGLHGAKTKSVYSYAALSPKLDTVLFADDNIFAFADLSDAAFTDCLIRADTSVGDTRYRFVFD